MKPNRLFTAILAACIPLAFLPVVPVAAGNGLAPASIGARAAQSLPRTVFTIPASNVASTGPLTDGQSVVYGVAYPRRHPPTCVSCGGKPFTHFRMHIYLRALHTGATGLRASSPRLLFTGPLGVQIALLSFRHGWLVYEPYLSGQWSLFTRNIITGRQIALDSPQREGTPSVYVNADTDGASVVWQSWTAHGGTQESVIRSYSLVTGQRRLLVAGGNGQDFSYATPAVTGNRVVFVRQAPDGTSRLFLEIVSKRLIRPLTPAHQPNSEPAISGNVVVWMHGRITVGHTHGLVVLDLANDRRIALPHSSAQLPRIADGRYVVFATDDGFTRVQVYDTRTGNRLTVAGPGASGQSVGNGEAETGGNLIVYSLSTPCASRGEALCTRRFAVVALP